ncbi:hypothetical protein Tco_0451797 [Tanacetum coccineum]
MDDLDITIEEYIQLKTKKALRHSQVFNWEIATYVKIRYDEDVHDLRYVKTEFQAIVYNDALTSELALSCEPTVSPQHIDKFNWKIVISMFDSDDENYTVIYDNDSFSYKIYNVDDLKLDMGNGDDKIHIRQSFRDLSIETLPNVININVSAYAQGSNKLLETSHDTSSKFFKTGTFIKELGKECFPAGRFRKLKPRADGPFRVLKKIKENAYKLELPGYYNVSATFNVADLSPYVGTSDD